MQNEYVIINKSIIKKRIEDLEIELKYLNKANAYVDLGKINALEEVLFQSIPLIPEIKKAYDAGVEYGIDTAVAQDKGEDTYLPDYISNLKLDI